MQATLRRVSMLAAVVALAVLAGYGHMDRRQQNTAVGAGVGAAAGGVVGNEAGKK